MKLRDYVTGRVLAWLAIAILGAWFGIGRAHANHFDGNEGAARSHCLTKLQQEKAAHAGQPAWDSSTPECNARVDGAIKYIQGIHRLSNGGFYAPQNHDNNHNYDVACPRGHDPVNGQCFPTESQCLDKPALGATFIGGGATSSCQGGCSFAPQGVPSVVNIGDGSFPTITLGGGWKPTGAACSVGDETQPPPIEEPQICNEVEGQSICVQPDGDHCHKATTGKYICWSPGETGEKTDGPILQKTNAGETAIPPANVVLPSGDTLVPDGPPVKVETSIDGNTSTTTTQNHSTQNGTNAGSGKGDAESDDGSEGDDGDGEGEGENPEDDDAVSGGGDCVAPPSCSGNALACWAINHNWKTTCDGVGDGVAGMDAFNQAIMDQTVDDAVEWGAELGVDGQGDLDSHRIVKEIATDELDASGFLGGGQCPAWEMPSVQGTPLPIDMSKLCDFLANIGDMVLALSYFLALRIIGGGGRK